MKRSSEEIRYSSLTRRLQAALVDGLVVIVLFILAGVLAGNFLPDGSKLRFLPFLVIFYEPLMLSLYGKTIGYDLMNQRVVSAETMENLSFVMACYRSLIKILLGWFSLVWMLITPRYQAIHDLWAHSLVIVDDPANERAIDTKQARKEQGPFIKIALLGVVIIILIIRICYSIKHSGGAD